MIDLIASLIILCGAVFLFAAGLGLWRMPDSYNRIQAGTKATTLGSLLVFLGLGLMHPDWSGKLLLLGFFILSSNPTSSHALARAALGAGIRKADITLIDRLQQANERQTGHRQPKDQC